MSYEYGKINQIRKGWWQAIRKHPVKALLALLVVVFVVVASSFFSAIGDQLARPKSPLGDKTNKRTIRITYTNTSPFVDRVVYGNDLTKRYWNVYLFQVQIHNPTASPLSVQHLKLTDLRQWNGKVFSPWDAEPVVLQWPSRTSKDIPPGDAVLVPFARIYPPDLQREQEEDRLYSGDVNVPQLRFTVRNGGWPRRMRSDVPPGKHRFKVTAFFTNALPAETELELDWPGEHRESAEATVQEITITQLR